MAVSWSSVNRSNKHYNKGFLFFFLVHFQEPINVAEGKIVFSFSYDIASYNYLFDALCIFFFLCSWGPFAHIYISLISGWSDCQRGSVWNWNAEDSTNQPSDKLYICLYIYTCTDFLFLFLQTCYIFGCSVDDFSSSISLNNIYFTATSSNIYS